MDNTQQNMTTEDLDLIDPSLEDDGKEAADLWNEIDQEEGGHAAADTDTDRPPPDDSGRDGDGDTSQAAAEDAGASGRDQQAGGDPAADLWSNATPEQRAAFEAAQAQLARLEQAERSNRGRITAYQRRIDELSRQSQQAPAAADGRQDSNEFLASDEWKSFAEEYPEVAGPMGRVIGAMQEQLTRANKELAAIGTERREAALSAQEQRLSERHSDWREVTDGPEFSQWLQAQPRHIQEATIRNAEQIVDADEAADVIGRFKQHLAATRGERPNADGGKPPRGTGNTDTLAARRARQLESSHAARGSGPGTTAGIPEDGDPEVLWRQMDEMERRSASR